MNDPVLQAYVDQKNRWSKIFGGKPLSLAIAADRQKIADCIDSDLSPETLTCDGELPRSEVQKRHKSLIAAARALYRLDPQVKIYELYTGE